MLGAPLQNVQANFGLWTTHETLVQTLIGANGKGTLMYATGSNQLPHHASSPYHYVLEQNAELLRGYRLRGSMFYDGSALAAGSGYVFGGVCFKIRHHQHENAAYSQGTVLAAVGPDGDVSPSFSLPTNGYLVCSFEAVTAQPASFTASNYRVISMNVSLELARV